MAILSAEVHARQLEWAERQFRLTVAVRTACARKRQPLEAPHFSYGKHCVSNVELALTTDEAKTAAAVLEHTTTYTLALQIVQAMKDVFREPHKHQSPSVLATFEIARLIRNSYAHQPFCPHWSIDPACAGRTFEVPRIARLDTTSLDGPPVRWQHYGGMLALLRLSQLVRSVILPSETVSIPSLKSSGS